MSKYLTAALWGFFWGYILGFALCMSFFVIMWWHTWMDAHGVLDVARQIFFSRAQYFFVGLGGYFAIYRAIYASDTVRRVDSTLRWLEFISSLFERKS